MNRTITTPTLAAPAGGNGNSTGRPSPILESPNDVGKLLPIIEHLEREADRLASAHRRVERMVNRSTEDADRLRSRTDELTHLVETALTLKSELARYQTQDEQLQELVTLAGDLRAQISTLRKDQDAIRRARNDAVLTLARLAERGRAVAKQVERAEERAGTYVAQVDDLRTAQQQVLNRTNEVRAHQLRIESQEQETFEKLAAIRSAVAKATDRAETARRLTDELTCKAEHFESVASQLESQVRAFDGSRAELDAAMVRTEGLADRLDALMLEASSLDTIEQQLTEVRDAQTGIIEQSAQVSSKQEAIDHKTAAALETLGDLARQSANLASQIAADRTDAAAIRELLDTFDTELSSAETRVHELSTAHDAIDRVAADATELTDRVQELERGCERLQPEVARVAALQLDVDRLAGNMSAVDDQVREVLAARVDVQAVAAEIDHLHRARERVVSTLDDVQRAQDGITKAREQQANSLVHLAEMQRAVESVRAEADAVTAMSGDLAAVRSTVDHVHATMETIDHRREQLEELDKRLRELELLGARLDGRGREFPHRVPGPIDGPFGWLPHVDFSVDHTTWEFGLQVRLAGRWRRGIAIWAGPIRVFLGVEPTRPSRDAWGRGWKLKICSRASSRCEARSRKLR